MLVASPATQTKPQAGLSRTTIHIRKTNFDSRQRQRRPAEAGRYKFKSKSNRDEVAGCLPAGRLALLACAVVDRFGCGFRLQG